MRAPFPTALGSDEDYVRWFDEQWARENSKYNDEVARLQREATELAREETW